MFLFFCSFYIFLCLFICKRVCVCEQGRGRERGRHRIPSRLCTVSTEPDMGLEFTNHEIMTRAEIESHASQSHPGAPLLHLKSAWYFSVLCHLVNIQQGLRSAATFWANVLNIEGTRSWKSVQAAQGQLFIKILAVSSPWRRRVSLYGRTDFRVPFCQQDCGNNQLWFVAKNRRRLLHRLRSCV